MLKCTQEDLMESQLKSLIGKEVGLIGNKFDVYCKIEKIQNGYVIGRSRDSWPMMDSSYQHMIKLHSICAIKYYDSNIKY